MFGIGMPELLLILAVALIVIGPKKLPDLARSLGKAMGEFKRATNDLKHTIEQETGIDEVRKSIKDTDRDIRRSLKDVRPAEPSKKASKDGASDEPVDASAPKDGAQQERPSQDSAQPVSDAGTPDEKLHGTTDQPKDNGTP